MVHCVNGANSIYFFNYNNHVDKRTLPAVEGRAMPSTLALMGREKKQPTDQVRLSKLLAKRLRQLAADADKSLPDYLTELIAPIVDKRFRELLKRLNEEAEE